MSSQLVIQAEPFEAYFENSAEAQQAEYRGRTARRSGSGMGGGRPAGQAFSRRTSSQYGATSRTGPLSQPGRGSPRRRRRPLASAYGIVVPSAGTEWVSWAQQCLGQVIGPWVPQSGRFTRATRRAIRMFQKRQGIPATGLLDGATESALRAACGGGDGPVSRASRPPQPPPGANGSQGQEPEPPADAGAADGPADATSDEPADEPAAASDDEVLFGERETGAEQEFQVTGKCEVSIRRHDPVPVTTNMKLPGAPGVYVIYVNQKAWYVGVTLRTIHQRFQDRIKAFRDFNLPVSLLANRTISWVAIRSGRLPACSIGRREQTRTGGPYTPLTGASSVLKILEQYYIQTLHPAGNKKTECVRFAPGGSLSIVEEGQPTLVLDAASKVFRTKKCEPF